jgi:hypothetical protein
MGEGKGRMRRKRKGEKGAETERNEQLKLELP